MTLSAVIWDVDPEIFNLAGRLSIRWYGVLFTTGLLLGIQVGKRFFIQDGYSEKDIDKLITYVFVATLVGARLGHCLFYEPAYYLEHPLEMILPFKWGSDGFEVTGYQGLASHGGILGVFLAICYFAYRTKHSIFSVLDKVAVGGSLTAVFIRLGNLMNSEIIGKPTGGDWGFIFTRVDNIPRHPGQLYEAIAYLGIFVLLYYLYTYKKNLFKEGFIFGLFFTLLFAARFFIEQFKIVQVSFEEGMVLNMGQLLSIPFMIGGIIVLLIKWNYKKAAGTS